MKVERVERILAEELARVAERGVAAAELKRARALLRSSVLHELGTHHGAGPGARAGARRCWATGARRGGRSSSTPASSRPTCSGWRVSTSRRPGATPWSLVPERAAMSQLQAPPVERTRLANGLQVVVAPRRGVPLVAVRLLVRAGSALDPARRFGLAHLVAAAVRRGTRRRSGARLDAEVEALGAELGGGVDEDAAALGLSAPLEALPRLLDVVADVAMRPSFPAARGGAAAAARGGGAGPRSRRAGRAGRPGHADGRLRRPRLRPPVGGARPRRGRRPGAATWPPFHARHWRPSRATLLVVGPVEAGAGAGAGGEAVRRLEGGAGRPSWRSRRRRRRPDRRW